MSDRLREQRETLGLSQQALADLCSISARSQRNYESGERLPDAAYLAALTAAGADPLYILHGTRLSEKELTVIGVMARLVQLGAPPDASSEAVMRFINANPDVDPMWLLKGQATKLDSPLNHKEAVLVTNYRAASAEGQQALEVQAAFFAQNNEAGKKLIEGTAALAAQAKAASKRKTET